MRCGITASVIKISARSEAQIRRTRNRWRINRLDARGAIDEELQQAFAALGEGSRIGQPVPTARRRGVMRLHLRRIHYYLYYRAVDADIVILAL